tara:strand:- start:4141 stop:4665 length:525 start_codon:yes stop_codon:yes gene_type:complete
VTLTDLSGKEIEVYFADDKTAASAKHSDAYEVKIEDVPSDKNWFEMTGGNKDMNEMDVNENSAGEGAHENFYQKLNKAWSNKVKDLEQSGSQIKIDDTIPSDFIETLELRPQSIYRVAGLDLLAKFVGSFVTVVPDGNKILLQMKRHGIVFYVEEGSLMKATDLEVQTYLEESK